MFTSAASALAILNSCQLKLAREITMPTSEQATSQNPETVTSVAPTPEASPTPTTSANGLQISPTEKSIVTYDSLTFLATGGNPALSFELVSGLGTLNSSSGLYTAPGTAGNASVRVVDTLGYASTSSLAVIAPTKISAGYYHSCSVLSDGKVQCWGLGTSGQIGNGASLSKDTPTYVSGISNASDIAAGNYHSCALLSTGEVKCWGKGISGQLGDGLAATSNVPVTVSGLSSAIAVGAGADFSCALISGGTVKCWGAGSSGQIGDGGATQRNTPASATGITGKTALAVGGSHVCVFASGIPSIIHCWGLNSSGQLGDSSTIQRNTAVAVTGITTATAIAAGATHSCALITGGSLKCWGSNGLQQLGDGTTINRNAPVNVTAFTGIATQISAGNEITCATLTDTSVQCWGDRLEDYTFYASSQPISTVTGLTNPVKVSPGGYGGAMGGGHACALQSDNRVKCWGDDSSGQLGTSENSGSSSVPVNVSGISGAISVSIGSWHGCAVITGGTVKCWGLNTSGFLGDGTTVSKLTPVSVSGITNATSVASNTWFSCALLSTGTVKCWGYNQFGTMGDGSTTTRITPVSVSGITTATAISTNAFNACALLSSGSVQCWGYNFYGEVGNGTFGGNQLTPVTVSGITTATAISTGDYHSCARLSTGTVKCWGMGSFGQLGQGSSSTSYTPVSVTGITTATAIAASSYRHSCAVLADGTVKCWGNGSSGQLGNGGTTGVNAPVTVSGISNATAITTGSESSCALLSTGEVKCWGQNTAGQLGDGTYIQRNTPVTVSGISNATAVTGTASSRCALLSTGDLKCWGDNGNGPLGDGKGGAYPSTSPVQVGPWQ